MCPMFPSLDLIDHELDRMVEELLEKYRLPAANRPEVERFFKEIKNEGYEAGYDDGHCEGYAAKCADVQESAYDEGYRAGEEAGYVRGCEHCPGDGDRDPENHPAAEKLPHHHDPTRH